MVDMAYDEASQVSATHRPIRGAADEEEDKDETSVSFSKDNEVSTESSKTEN